MCSRILDKILAQFVFTASETELDYYHQKKNIRVASRVPERLKTYNLRKLGDLKRIPEMLGFDGQYSAAHPKVSRWCFLVETRRKSAVKNSIKKPILHKFFKFVSNVLSKIVHASCPRRSSALRVSCPIWPRCLHLISPISLRILLPALLWSDDQFVSTI